MDHGRRTFASAAAAAMALRSLPALAQGYPARTVRLVVPTGAGNFTDQLSRLTAPLLADLWGHPVVVENLPGAGGVVGSQAVARSAPDGYTLCSIPSNFGMLPAFYKNLPFDPIKDFRPIAHLTFNQFAFVVNASFPARSVQELVAMAKAKPGAIDFGSPGSGSSPHLAFELFAHLAGVRMNHVPYRTMGGAITDVVGGVVPTLCTSIVPLLPHIKSGKLRAIGVSGKTRSALLPDVPTMAEAGVTGYEMTNWNGVAAPAGIPEAVEARIRTDLFAIFRRPEIVAKIESLGAEIKLLDGNGFADFIASEITTWKRLVTEAGVRV